MKELDFSPATHELNDLMFDVELISIITKPFSSENYPQKESLNITEYLSVINKMNRECLSVVSKDYRLIHNSDALNIGKQVFVHLFPSIKAKDLIPFKVIAPKRKTFCHIDLIHKDINFNVFDQDTWYPIIRVTNSYNKMYALLFEIGFVRKLCSNGMIFDKKTVTVKINHTKRKQDWEIKADIQKLKGLENEFISHMLNLKRFFLPKKYIFPLVCKALKLNYESKTSEGLLFPEYKLPNQAGILEEGCNLRDLSNRLVIKYVEKLGENAYSAFNVITDILSHQEDYKIIQNYAMRTRGLNTSLLEWIQKFTEAAEKRDFKIEDYLSKELAFPIFKESA